MFIRRLTVYQVFLTQKWNVLFNSL